MHILLINKTKIPVYAYGGTERVMWDLGKSLHELGHKVTYLVEEGSECSFANVLFIDENLSWEAQIPEGVDIIHFQFNPGKEFDRPYLVTEHGNARKPKPLPRNTNFISKNHAGRYGSDVFVHNGLDWSSYGKVDFDVDRDHYHFLGKAAWSVKNVQGAIDIAKKSNIKIDILGGDRINFKRGFRWTLTRKANFHGMVGGEEKNSLLRTSRGLIFPVRWHEPFGLAIIESMYFGAPVFATPYGAIPEIVPSHCGHLSNNADELSHAILSQEWDYRACHEHVTKNFNSNNMAKNYLNLYQKIIQGHILNDKAPFIREESRNLPWHS